MEMGRHACRRFVHGTIDWQPLGSDPEQGNGAYTFPHRLYGLSTQTAWEAVTGISRPVSETELSLPVSGYLPGLRREAQLAIFANSAKMECGLNDSSQAFGSAKNDNKEH